MKRPHTDRGDMKILGIWGAKHVTKGMRNLYRLAMTGRRRREAIRCKCLECCCWQTAEVRKCPSTDCPLWLYRMGRVVLPLNEPLERSVSDDLAAEAV